MPNASSKGSRDTIGIIGQSGSGKTTLLKQLLGIRTRVIIWDWRGEYDGDEISTLDGLPQATYYRKSFCVRYRPFQLDMVEEFTRLAQFLTRPADRVGRCQNFTFVIDEAALVTKNRQDGGLGLLLRISRHQSIDLLWATQHPSGLPGSLLSETSKLYSFRLENPVHVRMLAGRFAPDQLARIAHLPDFQFFETLSPGERGS